jgi:hypothetical protein
MGTKYEVSRLRKIAIARLRHIFPPDLDGYRSHFMESVGLNSQLPFTIAAISLARTCNVPSIAPLCFLTNTWMIASHTLENRALRNGRTYADKDGTLYTVSPEDSDLCLSGAWKFAERRRQIFHSVYKTHTTCHTEGCDHHALRLLENPQFLADLDPMPAADLFMKDFLQLWELCARCESVLGPAWEEAVTAAWRDLPSYFDLPPWEELLAIA